MSDQEQDDFPKLLARARGGDAEAWGKLLDSYRNYLKLLARLALHRQLRGKVSASDVVQETYLRALRFSASFEGSTEKELTAWLKTILESRLLEEWRHYCATQARNVRKECDFRSALEASSRALAQSLAGREDAPDRQAARREMEVVIADALSRLPEHYREAVIRRHLQGESPAEIGAETGWSADQIQKYVRRGLAELALLLGRHA